MSVIMVNAFLYKAKAKNGKMSHAFLKLAIAEVAVFNKGAVVDKESSLCSAVIRALLSKFRLAKMDSKELAILKAKEL